LTAWRPKSGSGRGDSSEVALFLYYGTPDDLETALRGRGREKERENFSLEAVVILKLRVVEGLGGSIWEEEALVGRD
jgi:hypothetical protein